MPPTVAWSSGQSSRNWGSGIEAFRPASYIRLPSCITTQVRLRWESVYGQPYGVDASSNLTTWSVLTSNLTLLSQIWQEKVIFFRKVEGDTLQVGHTSGT